MRDVLGPGTHLGYCTNVHAGRSLSEICANLRRFAEPVRRGAAPTQPLGVGLWLPHEAMAGASFADFEKLRATLSDCGLYVFTFNGFPYGDFHAPVVKHDVYRPDWADPARLQYTAELAVKLASLTAGAGGGISTLPIGWRADFAAPARVEAAAHALRKLAVTLHDLHERMGYLVHVDLEPEPGCFLQTSADVVAFFEKYLFHDPHAEQVRRYIRVCHDVCHSAVMFEPQAEAFRNYEAAGIEVGKVQISSALRVPFDGLSAGERAAALEEYRRFVEPRFLHQTVAGPTATEGETGEAPRRFFDDLPGAFEAASMEGELFDGEWRTHFHVPVFLDRIGPLYTTQSEIAQAIDAARRFSRCSHFEVETYAWEALPTELRAASLSEGIARELQWVRDQFSVGADE
jgi:sugar phosphate isomerase/epimerase